MRESQSILVISPDPYTTLHQKFDLDLNHSSVDVLVLDSDKSVGIDEIKSAKSFALSPPLKNPIKDIIIPFARKLTPEAQNALLKILEEPPKHLRIILVSDAQHHLLDTVISRCQLVQHSPQTKTDPNSPALDSLIQISRLNPAKRLDLLPPTPTKDAALKFIQQLIDSGKEYFSQFPTNSNADNLSILLQCQDRVAHNTNPTLTLTDAVLSLLPADNNPATMAKLPEKK